MTRILETERLILRDWVDEDRVPLAALNADPLVMRYFPAALTRTESDALMDRAMAKMAKDGFCFSPVVERASGTFLGIVGLSRPAYFVPLPFDPCVEIGWRLARHAWGKGIATEAARAWLRFGFETLQLDEIVSFTAVENGPSQAVMQRLGMVRDAAGDFDHPTVPEGHPLRRHVLYRLRSRDFTG